jgi:beta-galactosidase
MLENTHATVNFGGRPERRFQALREAQPGGPLMCTEFWDGWFDFWGFFHQTRSAARTARNLERILKAGASVNLYMWHGGTSFGFMNGANFFFDKYMPIIGSYDYDAPLSESGELTKKFHALRKVIGKYSPLPDEPLPVPNPKLDLEPVVPTEGISIWEALPSLSSPIQLAAPEAMEYLGQNHGFILYRTHLKGGQKGDLRVLGLRDRAQVFLDGKEIGILHRNRPQQKLAIHVPPSGARLDILVENMGRVNFGPSLMDRKGILDGVLLDGRYLFEWEAFCLGLEDLSRLKFRALSGPLKGPAFYRAEVTAPHPMDTFLALPGWTKGVAWVNGFNLGRYWKIGPQRSLYVPAPLINPGTNELVIFELHTTRKLQAVFRSRP